jgi:hypothetical protein
MNARRPLSTRAVVAIAGTALAGALGAPAVSADPLAPIIKTIQRDRQAACHDVGSVFGGFAYDKALEATAQKMARTERTPQAPAGYTGIRAFLGSGDPQAAAINSAYRRGAGQAIGNCANKHFGVGFVRHEDRSVDVVTIVFGAPKPPPSPPQGQVPPPLR